VRLTRFTDYSLRVLMYAAMAPAGRTTIADIAKAFGISQHHLTKVVHHLGRLGVLANTRGRNGGVGLARAAARINLGEVVRATEGTGHPAECTGADGDCPIAGTCRLEHVFGEAMAAFYAALDRYTLADLLVNKKALVAVLDRRPAPPAAAAAACR